MKTYATFIKELFMSEIIFFIFYCKILKGCKLFGSIPTIMIFLCVPLKFILQYMGDACML